MGRHGRKHPGRRQLARRAVARATQSATEGSGIVPPAVQRVLSVAQPGVGAVVVGLATHVADRAIVHHERLERAFFWPMGIASAGQMRQWGRHATAFVGRRHFDDPGLFDHYFVPGTASAAAQAPPR